VPVVATAESPATLQDDAYHFSQWQDGQHDGLYAEWWYFNLVDAENGLEAAFAYSIVDPTDRSGLGLASVLAVVYRPESHFQQLAHAGPEAFQASEEQADVSVATASGEGQVEVIDDQRYRVRGRVSGEHQVAWELEYVRQGVPWLGLDRSNVGRREWERMSWLVDMPAAAVTGEVTIDGRAYAVTGAPGYHDHNWGEWRPHAVKWNWAQYSEPGLTLALGDFMTAPEGVVGLDFEGRRVVFAKGQYRLLHTAWGQDEVNGRRFPTISWLRAENETVRLLVQLRARATEPIIPPLEIPLLPEPLLYEQTAEFTGRVWEKDEGGRWRLLRSFGGTGFKEYTTVTARDRR
jgi:hypothetical protein